MITSKTHSRSVRGGLAAGVLLLFSLVGSGCSQAGSGAGGAGGRTFATPQEGAQALVGALRPYDPAKLKEILGPEGHEIIASGDEVADRNAAETFVAAYDRKHDLIIEDDSQATLVVGDDDWPLPIPMVRTNGSWKFDAEAGKDEILARRIGRNELSTIEVCHAIVDAQRDYAGRGLYGDGSGAYAQKFLSDAGQSNGLYWEARPGEPESPLGPFIAEAVAEGYGEGGKPASGEPRPYHGYCYRMLTSQGSSAPGGARSYLEQGRMTGGFAAVAWPAEYENSGIMTFIVNGAGVVFQKDLGPDTAKVAGAMTSFDPGDGWEIVP